MSTTYQVRIGKKIIGSIDREHKVYAKQVDLKKHLLWSKDAWGIDDTFFKNELLPENYRIRLFEKQEQKVYETDAKTIEEKGFWNHFKTRDVDYGPQMFLPRQYWK
jgi:hypothetical protein